MAATTICVIFNSTAGRGRARPRLERLRRCLGDRAEFRPTQRAGHGELLALEAAKEGFAFIAAAGGDGTVHDVANGILRAGRPEVTLTVFPIGSANDYAHSLGLDADWWLHRDASVSVCHVDVGIARTPGGRERFFVNGLGLGFNGAVTLESRHVRGLRGVPLYGVALLRALCFRYEHPPMTVTIDGETRCTPTLALTVALGRREGNFVLAPDAKLDDGLFDYLHAGPISRLGLLRYLPRMITGKIPKDDLRLRVGRCKSVTVHSEKPLVAHVDGEFLCRPEEGIHYVEIELIPAGLRVQGKM